jgi:hypothetical protein
MVVINLVIYDSRKQYTQAVTDFFLYIEKKIPKDQIIFMDLATVKPSEIFNYLKDKFRLTSSYVDSNQVRNSPVILQIENTFQNNYALKESSVTGDIVPSLKAQLVDSVYKDPPVVDPPVVTPPSGNNSSSLFSGNSLLYIGGAIALYLMFKRK